MSGDQLDLDAIEARWGDQWHMAPNDVRALVAEVRRLRQSCIPMPEGLDRERAAGALWRLACAPLQWVTGPYPDDWPIEGMERVGRYAADEEPDDTEAEALREFQRANGLTVDGILGPQTWVALRARNESHPYD